MKNIWLIIIFLCSMGALSQNITEINSDLKLPDSLTHQTEIRIYQGGGISSYSSLFRMYKENKIWIVEFYEHYAEVKGRAVLKTKKHILTSKNDMEYVFQNFLRSNILQLPSEESIQWKLGVRSDIVKEEYKRRGKKIVEYYSTTSKTSIRDGEGFEVYVRALNSTNQFTYSNPDSYLRHYPDNDELIFMCEILNIVRDEFEIWEKD